MSKDLQHGSGSTEAVSVEIHELAFGPRIMSSQGTDLKDILENPVENDGRA